MWLIGTPALAASLILAAIRENMTLAPSIHSDWIRICEFTRRERFPGTAQRADRVEACHTYMSTLCGYLINCMIRRRARRWVSIGQG